MLIDANAAAESFSSCTFDWDGNTGIQCSASPFRQGKELSLDGGGWVIRSKCKVRVQIHNLPDATDLPKTNDDITVYLSEGGTARKMRIFATENTLDAELLMECVETNHAP